MDIKLVAIILCLSPTSIILTSMLVCLLGYLKVASTVACSEFQIVERRSMG